MEALIIIAIVVAVIVAGLLTVAYFTRKEFFLEREVTINTPKKPIFEYLKYLKNQDNFSVWSMMDPDMKKEYTGTDGKVGFVYTWESNVKSVGAGEQEIKRINEGQSIEYELRFKKPMKSKAISKIIIKPLSDDHTNVRWNFSTRMKIPFNLMIYFMGKEMGDQLQTGLVNLKSIIEKEQSQAGDIKTKIRSVA